MDEQGWVAITLIASFKKVSCLGYFIAHRSFDISVRYIDTDNFYLRATLISKE